MSTPSISSLVVDFFATVARRISKVDAGRQTEIFRELHRWRAIWKGELLFRDTAIRRIIAGSQKGRNICDKVPVRGLDQASIGIIADLDTQPFLSSRIASIISSSSPSLLAELREWQQAAHVIACIDTTVSYISSSTTKDTDPLTDRICDTMVATILSFLPPSDNRPAQQRVDDRERAVDRRVFYDEPRMQSLIASLDESSRIFLKVASDRERSRLPLFPAHFRNWDPELVRFDVDGQLNSFDSEYKYDRYDAKT